jgi:hypothetical protein
MTPVPAVSTTAKRKMSNVAIEGGMKAIANVQSPEGAVCR